MLDSVEPRLVHRLTASVGTVRVATRQAIAEERPGRGKIDLRGCPDPQLSFEDLVRTRGQISGWSPKSRVRMLYRLATIDWLELPGVAEMMTLTYPRSFPADGRLAKEHLAAFRKRFERRWGRPIQGTWKLEFQRRGAPHFHVYFGRPIGPWREFVDWARAAWYEIVGSGDVRHLRMGVNLDRQFCSKAKSSKAIAWYFAKHGLKTGVKSYQNDVPDGYENCGRFWGIWGLASTEVDIELTTQEFVELRRALVRFRRAQLRHRPNRVKAPSRLIGCWALSDDGVGFAVKYLAWMRGGSVPIERELQLIVDRQCLEGEPAGLVQQVGADPP